MSGICIMNEMNVCRELVTFLDMAFHYGSDSDKQKAEKLQTQLLQDDTKEAGVLNRVLQSMRQFKKNDKKIPKQEGRESRGYAVDMVNTLHVMLRVYERICKSGVFVMREPIRADAQDPHQEDGDDSEEDNDYVVGHETDDNLPEGVSKGIGQAGAATAAETAAHDVVEQPSTPRASSPASPNSRQDTGEEGEEISREVDAAGNAGNGLEDDLSDDENQESAAKVVAAQVPEEKQPRNPQVCCASHLHALLCPLLLNILSELLTKCLQCIYYTMQGKK
jgi:hypothetical protein